MRKQTHRKQTHKNQTKIGAFRENVAMAIKTLAPGGGTWREKQKALKTLASREYQLWSGDQGQYKYSKGRGLRGKTAKKNARKLTHIRGYYGKVKRGEIYPWGIENKE